MISSQHFVRNSIDIDFHITHMLTLTYPDTSNKTTKVYECLRRNRFDGYSETSTTYGNRFVGPDKHI